MGIGGVATATTPGGATGGEVPSVAVEPATPPELAGAAGSEGAEDVAPEVVVGLRVGESARPLGPSAGDVAPEVVVVGACDGPGRVAALVDALLVELRALSLESAGRGVLRGLVAALGRVRAGADAAEARVVAAVERLGDGGVDAVEVLRRNAGSSQREAQRRRRRAEALAAMPNVAGALAAGDISAEHADALARAAGVTSAEAVDGDAELLGLVAGVPADRAGRHVEAWVQRNQDPADLHEQHLRQRRRRRLNFGDGDDGMLMAHAAFDRVLGAQFRSLINGIADRIWRAEGGRDNPDSRSAEQRRLDALAIAVGLEPEPAAAVGAAGPDETAGRDETAGPNGAASRNETAGPNGAVEAPAAPDARGEGNRAAKSEARSGRDSPTTPDTQGNGNRPPTSETRGGRRSRTTPDTQGNGNRPAAPEASGGSHGPATRPQAVSPRHQIVIVASADVIAGTDPQGRCEIPGIGPIPQSELERLACDAELFGLLFSGEGEPLWHGRGERTATDAQRRALIARDGGCVLCAEEPSRCESHHVTPWAKPGEGPIDIDNLALLCGTCHRRLHNNKLILTRSPDGTWGTAPDPRHTGRERGKTPSRNAVETPTPRQRGP
ncbi:MAG: HNH endonuclease signature motif containing protein [bacterium]|nr:HNH endonuclease signature motif containing protein [bacterium]